MILKLMMKTLVLFINEEFIPIDEEEEEDSEFEANCSSESDNDEE